jgi:ribosomal protein S18 acetylase RimI-like enzyme
MHDANGGGDGLAIRAYREGDEAAVLALWQSCGIGRPWLDLRAEIAEKLRRDRELFLVAEAQGQVVGAVMGAYDGRRGWAYHLAVAPERRRRGLGRRLMSGLEVALARCGVSKLNLQVRADNLSVLGFYERLGYQDEHLVSLAKRLRSP